MNRTAPPKPAPPIETPRGSSPVVVGTCWGILSAAGYTAANICLRALADCDPVWVSCVKACATAVLVAPWLIVLHGRGLVLTPSWRLLGWLVAAGLVAQLAGNVLFQWSLGVIGVALVVPLNLGSMIVSAALVGRWFLRERVRLRTWAALAVLVVAIGTLSLGAAAANRSMAPDSPPGGNMSWLAAGVLAACISGVAYCILGVALRQCASRGMPVSAILTAVCLTGAVSLGALSAARIGPAAMWGTPRSDLAVMLLAGVLNAGAFLALIKALQLTGLVHVNLLNASQAAMAAVAGVVLFGEPSSAALLLGIGFTVLGLLLMVRRPPVATAADPFAAGLEVSDPVEASAPLPAS